MLGTLFKISLRNVIRRRLQSFLIAFMITLTTFLIFCMVGLQTGAYKLIEESYTQIFYGDIQVRSSEYQNKEDDFNKFIDNKDIENITNTLKKYKKTNAYVSKRYIHFGVGDSNGKNYAFQLIGINPKSEEKTSIIAKKIIKGSYLKASDYNGILIGQDLANFFNVKVGDEISLMTSDIYESFVIDVFTVKGIYSTGDIEMDKSSAFINFEYFQDNISYSYNNATNLTIKIDDFTKRNDLIKKLKSISGNNIKIIAWSDILPDIKQTIGFQFTVSMFFYVILVAIVGFAVLNALTLSTMKRIPEFGILNAIGLHNKEFKYILIFENIIIATFSVVLASLLGMIFILYFAKHGIPLPNLANQENKPLSLISNTIYPNPHNKLLLVGPLLMYVFTLGSIIPALLKLKNSKPIEAIRD